MEQTFGRDKAKRNIIIFVIGAFLTFLSNVVTLTGDVTGIVWLSYFGVVSFIGLILQIIAIILLRNVNKNYANALWMVIFNIIIVLTILILNIVAGVNNKPEMFETPINWLSIVQELSEALIVINFVLGTNKLAEESGKGMPVLTKVIIRGYVGVFLVSALLNLLSFLIPAIKDNQVAILIFGIILIVLYVIREIAYAFFLIKSLFRVE